MSCSAFPDIETKLTYLQWQNSYTETRPFRIAQFGRRKTKNEQNKLHNLIFQKGEDLETIRDIRGLKDDQEFTLEANGFAYRRYPPSWSTTPKDYWDPEQIRNVFLPECEAILRNEIEGIDRVFIFDWKVRKRKSAKEQRTRNQNLLNFAKYVHIDTLLTKDDLGTPMIDRIRNHLSEEDRHLLSERVQMINMWRPLNGPVEDHPMAVCDGRNINTSNLVKSDMIRGDYTGSLLYPLYEPKKACQWYYMSKQDVEDVLLFKSFDSKEGSVKHAPHTSFALPYAPDNVCPRISVEVRALVFTPST